jgi:two-component system chemotaxis sensor kinase CheA
MSMPPGDPALLIELLELEQAVLSQAGLGELPRGTLRLARLQDALSAARELLLRGETPETQQWVREALGALRALLAVEATDRGAGSAVAAGDADSTDRAALLQSLNDAALRMARCEVDDTAKLREIAATLRAASGSYGPSRSAGESTEAIAFRLDAIADQGSDDPEQEFVAASREMDALTAALADGALSDEDADSRAPISTGPVSTAADPAAPATAWALPPDTDPSLAAEFVTECREYIQGAEAALLELENDPQNIEAINTVFRAFHTIKGTSAFLGITLLSEMAHKAENLLSRVREAEIRCTGGYAELALTSLDAIKLLVEGVHQHLNGGIFEKPDSYDELIRVLEDPEKAGVSDEATEGDALGLRLGDLLVAANLVDRAAVEAAAREPMPIGQALVAAKAVGVTEVARALRTQKQLRRRVEEGGDASVRVRTDRLDRLIDMVGELVIAHSMVAQAGAATGGPHPGLARRITRTGKIVRELQDLSMSMRMVPLKAVFGKMARLARDLAHQRGRQVEFASRGEETEIDRHLVDVLADPLVHMIRNAVDHGIEPPEARAAAGKPPRGRITLSAHHAGGNVVVTLEDDGRGLDREKIARKAIERGLIETGQGMSDGDVYRLIFEAGFSTAEAVTEISGRGVGMDVVRGAVRSLNGRIEIQSEKGCGTTFAVKLPLTLAVTDGMLIRVGAQRFILPIASIHMSFRPTASMVFRVLGRGEMVMLRGDPVPIVRLHRVFRIPDAVEDPTAALVVVVDEGERRSAILVDELLGQQQVVAKPLGAGIGRIQGVAGGAILGDGRVGLILDPSGLIALARGGSSEEHHALLDTLAA